MLFLLFKYEKATVRGTANPLQRSGAGIEFGVSRGPWVSGWTGHFRDPEGQAGQAVLAAPGLGCAFTGEDPACQGPDSGGIG